MSYNLTIGIASDHAGFQLKELIKSFLETRNIGTQDFGTNSTESCDYPDYVHPLAQAIESKALRYGIVICGSGNGVCMTVNKYPSVRGALVWLPDLSEMARRHNDANVLCLPARYLKPEQALEIVRIFFDMPFDGGRHQTRVDKIAPH